MKSTLVLPFLQCFQSTFWIILVTEIHIFAGWTPRFASPGGRGPGCFEPKQWGADVETPAGDFLLESLEALGLIMMNRVNSWLAHASNGWWWLIDVDSGWYIMDLIDIPEVSEVSGVPANHPSHGWPKYSALKPYGFGAKKSRMLWMMFPAIISRCPTLRHFWGDPDVATLNFRCRKISV